MPNDNCLVYVKDHYVCSNGQRIISCEEVATVFPGAFNLENVTAAVAVGCYLNIDYDAIREGILKAKPLKYRFDNVGTFNGITFINASISTVPEVTIAHLRAFPGKIGALICGGFDRGVDQTTLAKEIVDLKVPFVVLFPTTGDLIKAKILEIGGYVPKMFQVTSKTGKESMEEAVREIFKEVAPDTICLHSPGAASFGLFKDYKERGRLFEEAVIAQQKFF
jgi:UDP-N-acetylmuramoylalanine--D-glutamate ligase